MKNTTTADRGPAILSSHSLTIAGKAFTLDRFLTRFGSTTWFLTEFGYQSQMQGSKADVALRMRNLQTGA